MTQDRERQLDELLGIDHQPATAEKKRAVQSFKWLRDKMLRSSANRLAVDHRPVQRGVGKAVDAALGIDPESHPAQEAHRARNY